MRSNKKLIIVISIVLILAVASSVIAYLYLMTDVFKSKQELFMKYFAQNVESFQKVTNLQTFEVYENLKNQNKYESIANVKLIDSKGGEVSEPINNLALKLEVQQNNEEQYLYADGQLLFEDEKYLEAEVLKEQGVYGIRFTDAVKQFVSVKNDENLAMVADKIGTDVATLQKVINILEGTEALVDRQQVKSLQDKYINIITKNISNGTFSKQRNAMITYNNVTTQTNAYSVLLSSQHIENMLIEILNNVKNDMKFPINIDFDEAINMISNETEAPTVKITVYEQDKKTIRTVVEIGLYKITLESTEQNGDITIKINYFDSETTQIDTDITKKNTETQENFEIAVSVVDGDKNYIIALSNQMQLLDKEIKLDAELSYKENITIKSIKIENEIMLDKDFEKSETLSKNNIILNDLEENRAKEMVFILNQVVPPVINERTKLLEQKFGLKDGGNVDMPTDNTQPNDQISQVEINKFNSKFEFYTGDEVSAENVRMLLDIVKKHLVNCEEIVEEQQPDAENQSPEEEKVNIKLKIEKDILNEDVANQILEKIDDSKKYKVSIIYKEENGLIEYITITEV